MLRDKIELQPRHYLATQGSKWVNFFKKVLQKIGLSAFLVDASNLNVAQPFREA